MRTALDNTFAIYINGRRRAVTSLTNSGAPDAPDPYKTYVRPPAPLAGADDLPDLIRKTGEVEQGETLDARSGAIRKTVRQVVGVAGLVRSEEHTSELQSLMRTSYAVFCLTKKTRNKLTT